MRSDSANITGLCGVKLGCRSSSTQVMCIHDTETCLWASCRLRAIESGWLIIGLGIYVGTAYDQIDRAPLFKLDSARPKAMRIDGRSNTFCRGSFGSCFSIFQLLF